jgi:hypothetical protein
MHAPARGNIPPQHNAYDKQSATVNRLPERPCPSVWTDVRWITPAGWHRRHQQEIHASPKRERRVVVVRGWNPDFPHSRFWLVWTFPTHRLPRNAAQIAKLSHPGFEGQARPSLSGTPLIIRDSHCHGDRTLLGSGVWLGERPARRIVDQITLRYRKSSCVCIHGGRYLPRLSVRVR